MMAIAVTFVPPPDDVAVADPPEPPTGVMAPRACSVARGVAVAEAARGGRPTDCRQLFSRPSWSKPYTDSNALSAVDPSLNVLSSAANFSGPYVSTRNFTIEPASP